MTTDPNTHPLDELHATARAGLVLAATTPAPADLRAQAVDRSLRSLTLVNRLRRATTGTETGRG